MKKNYIKPEIIETECFGLTGILQVSSVNVVDGPADPDFEMESNRNIWVDGLF